VQVAVTTEGGTSNSLQFTILRKETELTITSPQDVDYSDSVQVSATLADDSGIPIGGKEIQFTLNSMMQMKDTDENGYASTDFIMDESQGMYTISAAFAGDDVYLDSQASTGLMITKETATIEYTGDYMVKADELIALSATITEEDDGRPGDIQKAGEMIFEILNPEGTTVRTESKLIDNNGKAEIITDSLPTNIYTVRAYLADNGYYEAAAVESELVVYDPEGGFATGGGFLCDEGFKTFAFCVKPSSLEPWLPRGRVRFVDRSDFWNPIKVKASEFVWLVIPEGEDIAYIAGVCSYDGQEGYTFYVEVEDIGGWINHLDTIHITVLDSEGITVYEAQGNVDGGNIKIHH
jgi:hypothetical protein